MSDKHATAGKRVWDFRHISICVTGRFLSPLKASCLEYLIEIAASSAAAVVEVDVR